MACRKSHHRGAFVGVFTAIGIGVGTAIGVASHNMSTWMILGGGLGALLGGVIDALAFVRER